MAESGLGARRNRTTAQFLAPALVLVVLVTAATVLAGCSPQSSDRFVTRSGATLQVDGRVFRFVGFNLYDAAASDLYSCKPALRLDDDGLDDAMRAVHDAGGTVVRFWAYQPYTAGGTDFSGVDRVLRAARAHGLRVIPALEDGPGNCSTGLPSVPLRRARFGTWYTDGYRMPLGSATVSYRVYAARVARRYRDDPTILAWSLLNEAETADRDPRGRSVLVDFAADMAAVVRAVDPHHLITLGTQSNGAAGASGADFRAVYELPGLDLAEVHDWGSYGSDTEAMPGALADGSLPDPEDCDALDAQIACSFAIARDLGKPVFVGEAGITADDSSTADDEQRRADLLRPKIAAAFAAGAAGYLVWQLNTANSDGYGVLVASRDPTFDVLREVVASWRGTS